MSVQTVSVLPKAIVAQVTGCFLAGFVMLLLKNVITPSLWWAAALQAVAAAAVSQAIAAERWWIYIHLGFSPLVVFALNLRVEPTFWLSGFLLLVLIYGATFRTRVPLYLSNQKTAQSFLEILPDKPGLQIADLGMGVGHFSRWVAMARPDVRMTGIEQTWLPYALARIQLRKLTNCKAICGDFWTMPLNEFDVVYVFLSPVPMPGLWEKACAEMRPGSLLVSNSFRVPDVEPTKIVEVSDQRNTKLFCYQI